MALSSIRVEDEVFLEEGQVGIGAVRLVQPSTLTIFIEGYGDIEIGADAVASAHDGKVLLKLEALDEGVQAHLAHVHDGELRDPSKA